MSASPISRNHEILKQWRSTLNNKVLKSPCMPVEVPECTVVERVFSSLRTHASLHPTKPAIIEAFHQARRLTHQQIHDQALSFAAFLVSRGFKEGDRLTAALTNSIELPVLHLGTWAAGGSIVGSSAAFKLYDTVYQLCDSDSSVVVTSENQLDMMIMAAKECPSVKSIICIRSSEKPLPEGIFDFMETLKCDPLERIVPVTLDSESTICYSSGTTGVPKGVIHTHRTFHCHIELLRSHWIAEVFPMLDVHNVNWYEEYQIITSSCLHLLGFTLLNWFLISGSPVILMKAFDGIIYQNAIEKFKPRFLIVTPPMVAYLAKDPKRKTACLSSVKLIMSTTAPLSKELSFGMTEVVFSHLPLLLHEGVNASVGVLASLFKQRIFDPETLRPCKQGEIGELFVKGPPQTIGYLNKPDATRELIDEEGWIHTGDIGYIDERGLLYIVDRKKELIKVSPAEIEGVLISSPNVKDVAIIGISNDAGGELVRAYIVKADEKLTVNDVESIVAEKLAEFKHITGGVVFVEAIPRSANGKILKRVLRENGLKQG